MKTLPDSPDLTHLRRQAKDLLAGLRDADPAATLAAAQASLARQYGFRDWPGLKAEVERRAGAGSADTADPELARELAQRFDLGTVTGAMRSVARADEAGRRWTLSTDRGRWAVRTVDDVYPPTDGEADTALQEAAACAGVLVPRPVRSTSGAVVAVVGGHRWRVHEWLHSGPPLAAPVGAATAGAVGATLATIHGLAVPVDRISGWYTPLHSRSDWSALVSAARGAGRSWADQLIDAAGTLAELRRFAAGPEPAEPPVLVHNNLTPGNVRLGEGGRLVVTGWEHAGGQPPSWELGHALVQWVADPDGGVNAAAVRALLDGYRAVAGGAPALGPPIFRGAAAALGNYVFGQVEIALRDVGDDVADRGVRHLLAHLPTTATVEEILAAAG